MADLTFLRRRALASRNPARRSRISASKPPCSPAFTMLIKSRLKTRGCLASDSWNVSPPCTRAVISLTTARNAPCRFGSACSYKAVKACTSEIPASTMVESCRVKRTRSVSFTLVDFLREWLAVAFRCSESTVKPRLIIIDPIPLPATYRTDLESLGRVARIVITNANHARNAATFAHSYSAPIFAPPELRGELRSHNLHDGLAIGPLRVIRIEGAADGEFALYHPDDGGTLIMGDALINFDPHGFTLLPRKYCTNQKQMVPSPRN